MFAETDIVLEFGELSGESEPANHLEQRPLGDFKQIQDDFLSHWEAFQSSGDMYELDQAIYLEQKAIQLDAQEDVTMPKWLDNLGIALLTRFGRTGEPNDLAKAVELLQKAVELTQDGHAEMPRRLNNLGMSLQARFDYAGKLMDATEALSLHRKALRLTPEGHADMHIRFNNLGASFQSHFKHTGDLTSVTQAISLLRTAIQLTPEGHAAMPSRLTNLGVAFQRRFGHSGDLIDLNEAISCHQKALQLEPERHADRRILLNNLGMSFQSHFDHTSDLESLAEARSLLERAVELTPEGHSDMAASLNNLGSVYQSRFQHTLDLSDLDKAIILLHKSVLLTPEGHADMPVWLNNLANSYQDRFSRNQSLEDLNEAISLQRKAISLLPEEHADMPQQLSSLGMSFQGRFSYSRDIEDLNEAMSYQQKAIDLIPEGHASMSKWLDKLGNAFQGHFEVTNDPTSIERAIDLFGQAATMSTAHPSRRLWSARKWANISRKFNSPQLLDACKTIVLVISQVAGLEHTVQQRYSTLPTMSTVATLAAAAAFESRRYDLALEWLEEGRCLVWRQLNDLRAPLDTLHDHDPAIAAEISRVSMALEQAGSREEAIGLGHKTSNMTRKISIQDEALVHIRLAREWGRLLQKVRDIPGFEDFLQPASCATLLEHLPAAGFVIVINIHVDRSDALALSSGSKEPLHIHLGEFTFERASSLRKTLNDYLVNFGHRMRGHELDPSFRGMRPASDDDILKNILHQLWTLVARPILDAIGYLNPPPDSEKPRIWWCATDPLAFLPIHAAGIYTKTGSIGLSDFAISSYTPTVTALAEKVKNGREFDEKKSGIFLVSQPKTPGLQPIPGTTKEGQVIERLLDDHHIRRMWLDGTSATVERTLENMNAHSCVHLACHATQNTDKPLESGFFLYDGKLQLSDIIKVTLIDAEFAFLSACQTSTGDERLSEEAVHLAAGMLAAGYRGVVATMWSIQDKHGPEVAEHFYKHLLNHGSTKLSGGGAARALHYAIQEMKKKRDDSDRSLLDWVAYIHIGL